jgi:hypothetical protein
VSPPLPRFVITGAPRSGTLFLAEALARLGHRCGHEEVFNPYVTSTFSFGSAQGDVSWLAAPFLDRLPPGTIVVHQLRDPLAVITSLVGQRFLQTEPHPMMLARYRLQHHRIRVGKPITNPLFIRFAADHCPDVFSYDDEPTRSAHFWTSWTALIARGADRAGVDVHRVRVEDLDGPALLDLCHAIGGRQTLDEVERVRVDRISLDDITDRTVRDRLVETAAAYGYDLEAPAASPARRDAS